MNTIMYSQLNDPVMSRVIQFIKQGKKPLAKELLHESSDVKRLVRDWPKLVVKDSLLKRNLGKISEIVLPKKYYCLAIKALHPKCMQLCEAEMSSISG